MTSSSIPSSILPSREWVAHDPVLWLPFIGTVSVEALSRFASRVAFILLLAAAGTLLVHPGDLVPGLEDLPVYQVLVTCCLMAALPGVIAQLSFESLRANAVTCLVLLLVATAALSHLARGSLYDARQAAMFVGKVSLLYLLVVSLVNSPARLRITLAAVAAFVLGMTLLAVFQYHDVLHLQGLAHVERHAIDSATDEVTVLVRLCGIGLFNDPNDLSLVLVISIVVCGYFLNDRRLRRGTRSFLLAPVSLFCYALYLTHSRGGMVSALVGLMVFVAARYGKRNALALACLLLPVLVAASWGRTAAVSLEDPEDTFQTRLELWSGSFDALRSAPLVGIGQGRLMDEIGQVAHNSYLHAFAEMGLIGGTAFIGTFYLILRGLWRAQPEDSELARMRPYVLALMASYAAGLMSLSRCYHAPTLLVIAIATAYLALASRGGPAVVPRFDGACVRRITGFGLLFLAVTYAFLRLMLQRGAT
jgi:NADH:ubiquinone oxidoreductase subunit 6 (subunit J)